MRVRESRKRILGRPLYFGKNISVKHVTDSLLSAFVIRTSKSAKSLQARPRLSGTCPPCRTVLQAFSLLCRPCLPDVPCSNIRCIEKCKATSVSHALQCCGFEGSRYRRSTAYVEVPQVLLQPSFGYFAESSNIDVLNACNRDPSHVTPSISTCRPTQYHVICPAGSDVDTAEAYIPLLSSSRQCLGRSFHL